MKSLNVKISKLLLVVALTTFTLGACSEDEKQAQEPITAPPMEWIRITPEHGNISRESGAVFVHLFEWSWPDIATECEEFLGPKGYTAVQVSPPQEHINGPQWWTRYQPVSYRIESRGGTRAEFADMVKRCKAVGVGIYADTIINHMADVGSGTGIAGSEYTEYNYPVPYTYDSFHHCGRNGDGSIANYQDLWEVQTCSLGKLPDLDTGNPTVQKNIASYINDLMSLGVTGIRLDAAKHIAHQEIEEIMALVEANPFVFLEVIDRGDEPISSMAYTVSGRVTEFKYPQAMLEAFGSGRLGNLTELGTQAGFLPSGKAVVFIDNHDTQRGHTGTENILTFKRGKLYDLTNVFMLGWPYGYPKVMSSYRFEDREQGPPDSRPVKDGACTADWVCEHRRAAMAAMVGFRKITAGTPVTNWQVFGDDVVSFGRGDKGHVIINIGSDTVDGPFVTSMNPGDYCNVVSSGSAANSCNGSIIQVGTGGALQISIAPMSAVVIHTGSIL